MEDFFQIIIIIVFIVSSIISSLNKNKKKKQAKNKKPVSRPVQMNKRTDPFAEPKPVAKQKQKSSAELLEELLGLKIELPEPQKKEAPKVYSEDSHDTWDPTREYEEVKPVKTNNYQQNIDAKKSEFQQDKQKHRAFKEERVTKPIIVKKETRFGNLLKEQNSLKDLIVVQEILNKPKSLRR